MKRDANARVAQSEPGSKSIARKAARHPKIVSPPAKKPKHMREGATRHTYLWAFYNLCELVAEVLARHKICLCCHLPLQTPEMKQSRGQATQKHRPSCTRETKQTCKPLLLEARALVVVVLLLLLFSTDKWGRTRNGASTLTGRFVRDANMVVR